MSNTNSAPILSSKPDMHYSQATNYQRRTTKRKVLLLLVILIAGMIIILLVKPKRHSSPAPAPPTPPPVEQPPSVFARMPTSIYRRKRPPFSIPSTVDKFFEPDIHRQSCVMVIVMTRIMHNILSSLPQSAPGLRMQLLVDRYYSGWDDIWTSAHLPAIYRPRELVRKCTINKP